MHKFKFNCIFLSFYMHNKKRILVFLLLLSLLGYSMIPINTTAATYDVTITITSLRIHTILEGGRQEWQLQAATTPGNFLYSNLWMKSGVSDSSSGGTWYANELEEGWPAYSRSRLDDDLKITLWNVQLTSSEDFCYRVVERDGTWESDPVAPDICIDIDLVGTGTEYGSSFHASNGNYFYGNAYIRL